MDVEAVLEKYALADFAVGSGGCWNHDPMECCERDITVFDGRDEADLIAECSDGIIRVHHGTLNESRSAVLVQLCDLAVLRDDGWEIRMLLSRLDERRDALFRDSARDCLLDAMFCTSRARQGLASGDGLAPVWLKCAAFYLADAACLAHGARPSPAHMLGTLRRLRGDPAEGVLDLIHTCTGIGRATPTLLDRMSRSAAGLSDLTEGNGHSRIIAKKYRHMTENRQLADCHFYLGYVSRNLMVAAKESVRTRPSLGHILRVSMDVEADTGDQLAQCRSIRDAADGILSSMA